MIDASALAELGPNGLMIVGISVMTGFAYRTAQNFTDTIIKVTQTHQEAVQKITEGNNSELRSITEALLENRTIMKETLHNTKIIAESVRSNNNKNK